MIWQNTVAREWILVCACKRQGIGNQTVVIICVRGEKDHIYKKKDSESQD